MNAPAAADPRPARSPWFLLVATALAAIFLYLSFRKLDWRQVWLAIANCRVSLLLASMAIACVSYFCRGLRWRVLLNTQANLPILRVFWANSAGYLGNNVLPARAGELIRTAMVSSESGLSKAFVLTTALAERLMDVIFLVVSGSVLLRFIPNKPGWLSSISTPLLILACAAALLLISIPFFETFAERAVEHLPLSPKFVRRVDDSIEHIAAGVRSFHDPARFSLFLLLTIAIWSLDSYSAIVLATSLGMKMSFAVALLLIVGLGMGSALPSTPGYVGIYQFVAVSVLMPFNFTRAEAIAYILVAQAGALVVTGVLGSVGALQYRRMQRLTT